MDGKIIKLSFQGPVHFGSGRLSDAEYTCDAGTLFSAFFIEAFRMGDDAKLLEGFSSGECSISDAFPYVGDALYLPKPMTVANRQNGFEPQNSEVRARKAAKKLKYIPMGCLDEYLDGAFDAVGELERFALGASHLRTKVNLTRAFKQDADPYFVGGFSFNAECGIYFIYRGCYDLEPILEQLSFSGIGGKRSSGYGAFRFSIEDLAPTGCPNRGRGRYMLLSSAAPREDELTKSLIEGARYRMERKGGFVQSATHALSPRRKKDLWMFCPGSIFERRFEGDVFDVNDTPGGHPVHRYARAMWMEV